MTKDSRLARKARHENIPKIITVLQTTRAGQRMTIPQLKSGAKSIANRLIQLRRKELKEARKQPTADELIFMKELKKEEELDNASSVAMSNDITEFLSVSESSGESGTVSTDGHNEVFTA